MFYLNTDSPCSNSGKVRPICTGVYRVAREYRIWGYSQKVLKLDYFHYLERIDDLYFIKH